MTRHVIDSYEALAALHYNSGAVSAGDVVEIVGEIDASAHNGQIGLILPGTVDAPILVTGGGTITGPGLRIIGTHVRVDGLTLVGATWGGLNVSAWEKRNAHSVHISGCMFSQCAAGVWIENANDVTVTGCTFRDLRMNVADDKPDNDFGANAVHITKAADVRVTRCVAVNLNAPSPDYGTDGGFVELYGDVSGVVVTGNRCYDVVTLFESGGNQSTQESVTVWDNVLYLSPGNTSSSRQQYTIHTPAAGSQYRLASMRGFVLRNNTFYNIDRSYIPGRSSLAVDVLDMRGDTVIGDEMSEAEFFAAHPVKGKPEPEPPTVEPNPPAADGDLILSVSATLDGEPLLMRDRLLALKVPRETISEEERTLLELLRGLPEHKRKLVHLLAANLAS